MGVGGRDRNIRQWIFYGQTVPFTNINILLICQKLLMEVGKWLSQSQGLTL